MERVREHTSLFPCGTDVGCLVTQAPEVLPLLDARCLKLLTNTVALTWGLWNVVSCWRTRRQFLGAVTVKDALRWPVRGRQLPENQLLLALCWSLTCAYRATIQYYQRTGFKRGTQTSLRMSRFSRASKLHLRTR